MTDKQRQAPAFEAWKTAQLATGIGFDALDIWTASRKLALEEAEETERLLFCTLDALQSLLDDTQHKEHPDCKDGGYCPVRDAREAVRNFIAWQMRRAAAIRQQQEEGK